MQQVYRTYETWATGYRKIADSWVWSPEFYFEDLMNKKEWNDRIPVHWQRRAVTYIYRISP